MIVKKILSFDEGTLSAPAFLNLVVEANGEDFEIVLQGKSAKKVHALAVGDPLPDGISWRKANVQRAE